MALETPFYDAAALQWPGFPPGSPIAPVRVGMDRRTGKIMVGWPHVEQSLGMIFSTRFHERPLRRWVGSFVPHILAENMTERAISRFYWAIAGAIDLWEPCYRIKRVSLYGTSSDIYRTGGLNVQNYGIYRPRAHLGDTTPEQRRSIGLISPGVGHFEQRGWRVAP